ncbi:MAG: hypothetical protein HY372_01385 [Candidatus Andersenbacteria bacterium]|nr:hypothetical protein [Candidatus Andersenbacteria bacterium]
MATVAKGDGAVYDLRMGGGVMTHYTCTGGCGAEAETPGVCGDADCLKEGQQLTACDCADGEHGVDEDEYESARR